MKAKKISFISVLAIMLLTSNCAVISFYPLYTDDVLIRDDRIIGKWASTEVNDMSKEAVDTLIWEIKFNDKKWVKKHNVLFDRGSHQVANRYAYSLHLYYNSKPEDKVEFLIHLVELDGKKYVDFYPEQWDANNTILAFHLIGVHTFAKIDINDAAIDIEWFDTDWLMKKLEENKIRIKYEQNSANILLTAQPKDLQNFVIKYSDDEEAFNDDYKSVLTPINL